MGEGFSAPKGNLEDKLTIISTGSIASGKSTFLSGLHATLGYDKIGVRIGKQRLPKDRKGQEGRRQISQQEDERRIKGMFRSNATDTADLLSVYASSSGRLYQVDFIAPGGHSFSEKPEINGNASGLLYFADLNLACFLAKMASKERTLKAGNLFYGMEVRVYVEEGESLQEALVSYIWETIERNRHIKPVLLLKTMAKDAGFSADLIGDNVYDSCEALALALEPMVNDLPQFGLPVTGNEGFIDRRSVLLYKGREILGEVVQSVIESNNTAVSAAEMGIPVLGVGTHRNLVYGKLPQPTDELVKAVEGIFNTAIAKYAEYLKSHGLERDYKRISLDSLAGNPLRWQTIDLMSTVKRLVPSKYDSGWTIEETVLNRKNPATVKIAQDMIARALHHRGIEPEGLKILTYRGLDAAKESIYAKR